MKEFKQFVSKFRSLRLNKAAHRLQGEINFHGLIIKIENRVGSLRHWKDDQGNKGITKMLTRYGYIARSPQIGLDKQTLGVDGDAVDVYLSDINKDSQKVFVIHQKVPETGEYDEDKCMLGFNTAKQAKDAYLKQYDNPEFFDSMEEFTLDEFKEALKTLRGHKITKLQKALDLIENRDSLVFVDQHGHSIFSKDKQYAEIFKAAGIPITRRKLRLYRPASTYSQKELAKATLLRNKYILLKVKFANKRGNGKN